MTTYAQQAAFGAAAKTNDQAVVSAGLRSACLQAASTADSQQTIYRSVRKELLGAGLTENGAKSMASKIAKVAVWVRSGGTWKVGDGLNVAYKAASSKVSARVLSPSKVVCPSCAHEWVPYKD